MAEARHNAWELHVDDATGAKYLWNRATGESRWMPVPSVTSGPGPTQAPADSAAVVSRGSGQDRNDVNSQGMSMKRDSEQAERAVQRDHRAAERDERAVERDERSTARNERAVQQDKGTVERDEREVEREVARVAAEQVIATQRKNERLRAANRQLSSQLRAHKQLQLQREAFSRLKHAAFPLGRGKPGGLEADDVHAGGQAGDESSFTAGSVFGTVLGVCITLVVSSLWSDYRAGYNVGRRLNGVGGGVIEGGGGSGSGSGAMLNRPRGFVGGSGAAAAPFPIHAVMVELVAYSTHIHLPMILYIMTHDAVLTLLACYVAETVEWINNAFQLVSTHTYDDPLEDVVLGLFGMCWGMLFVSAWQIPKTWPFAHTRDGAVFTGFAWVYGIGCSLTMSLAWSWPRRFGLSMYAAWASGVLTTLEQNMALPADLRAAIPPLCIVTWAYGVVFALCKTDAGGSRSMGLAFVVILSVAGAYAVGYRNAAGAADNDSNAKGANSRAALRVSCRARAVSEEYGAMLSPLSRALPFISVVDGLLFLVKRSHSACNSWLAVAVALTISALRSTSGPRSRWRRQNTSGGLLGGGASRRVVKTKGKRVEEAKSKTSSLGGKDKAKSLRAAKAKAKAKAKVKAHEGLSGGSTAADARDVAGKTGSSMRKRVSIAEAPTQVDTLAARPLGAAVKLAQSRGPGDVAHLISDDSDSDYAAI
eukprot:g1994.t1